MPRRQESIFAPGGARQVGLFMKRSGNGCAGRMAGMSESAWVGHNVATIGAPDGSVSGANPSAPIGGQDDRRKLARYQRGFTQ